MPTTWSDVFPAATTHFHADGSLDFPALERHLEIVIQSGVSGLVMLGSLGENVSLGAAEKADVIRCAVGVANGRLPVVSGVAELNTATAVAWAKTVASVGGAGLMVMPAMAYRADADEAVAHYGAVAAATDLPVIAYNNPLAYHVDLTPAVMDRLASHENITMIKESCGDPRRVTDLVNALGDRFTIFAGVDDLILECTMLGATGWIAGIGLAFPAENQRLWDLMMAQRWEEARTLYRWFSPLAHLDVGSKFVQNIKLAIQEVGLGAEHVRLPRLPLVGAEREHILSIIHAGIESRPVLD